MSKKKITQTSLPLSRTTKIMNSAVGVESVDQDIVALATKATELFLIDFAKRAYASSDSNVLEYEDIQRLVHNDQRYDFLVDTTPKKIKFSEALKLIEASKQSEERELKQREQQQKQQHDQEQEQHQQLSPGHDCNYGQSDRHKNRRISPMPHDTDAPASRSGDSRSPEVPGSYRESDMD